MLSTLSYPARMDLPTPLRIAWTRPLHWLVLAGKDMARAPQASLTLGLLLALLGVVILWLGHNCFWLLAGALSSFLVIGPVVATSFYAISRALEQGEPVRWVVVWRVWTRWQQGSSKLGNDYWCLVQFGLLLGLSALAWVAISASLITLCAPARVDTPLDFLRHVVIAPDGNLFHLWLALGSFLAAPIFASSVVSMPLLLDRKVTLPQAVLTSWLVILQNPVTMALWAGLIVMLSLLGLASLMLGLVLVMPLLGHASWHAYRDLVDASDFAPREAA